MSAGSPRAFREVEIDNFYSQDCVKRFNFRWPRTNPDGPFHIDPPKVRDLRPAPWRLNLTALSQRYNLYFAAIQDKLHLVRPRDLKPTIPGEPDLIIQLPQSTEAISVGGYISHSKPHCVNHLVVGNLGIYEILLLACDDGDVLAYYTKHLNHELHGRQNEYPRPPIAETQPMFHENVGMSAWGLAIHQKTRLIAVSSNLREITVFVFGQRWTEDPVEADDKQDIYRQRFPPTRGTPNKKPYIIQELSRNTRRILKFPPNGHNVPSVAFADNLEGHAKSVLATDILGNLWVMNIWETARYLTMEDSHVERLVPSCHQYSTADGQPMGWGVMVVPLRYFRFCQTPESTFGWNDEQDFFTVDNNPREPKNALKCHLNISSTLYSVTDSSRWPPSYEMIYDSLKDFPTRHVQFAQKLWRYYQLSGKCPLPLQDVPGPAPESYFDFLLTCIPPLANTIAGDNLPLLEVPHDISLHRLREALSGHFTLSQAMFDTRNKSPGPILPDGSAIFRTFTHDVELIPPLPSDESLHTVCNKLLHQDYPENDPPVPVTFEHMQRLSILLRIDDLGLAIVGSQAGRVALLGLTRLMRKEGAKPLVGFRIERILPGMSEENMGYRPLWGTLMGVAVSPVQCAEVDEEDEKEGRMEKEFEHRLAIRRRAGDNKDADADEKDEEEFMRWRERDRQDRRISRRWRLLLHYSDHTILSWELSRDEATGKLAVF